MALVTDERARFCPQCGTLLETPAEAEGGLGQITVVRNRLGGRKETIVLPATSVAGTAASAGNDDTDHDFVPAPGTEHLRDAPQVMTRKRRRRRKPLYRRPLILIPVALLVVFLALTSTAVYRVGSTLNTMHEISTIPPVVQDSTYNDPDSADPNEPPVPSDVDTGPARTALETSDSGRSFSGGDGGGFTSGISSALGNTGDLARSAIAAAGVNGDQGQPMTLLVMGVDARPGAAIDIGVRPDAFMLVRLDPVHASCRVLSVPRDTRVDLPGYGESKINHALMVGGIPYELMVTEDYLGITIDHYLLVDFQAFEQMVDMVGGITVNVPTDLSKNGELRFKAGTHEFDGEQTLAYARFRSVPDGDAGRVQRQWTILSALAKASVNRSLVSDVNTLLPQLESHIRTDLSAEQMVSLARQYGDICRHTDADSIRMLDGSRVRLSDPILDQTAYFNVVSETTKKARIDEFLAGKPESPSPFPSTPVPATPVSSPAATPAPDSPAQGRRNIGTLGKT